MCYDNSCHVKGESILDPKDLPPRSPAYQFIDRYLFKAALSLTLVLGFFPYPREVKAASPYTGFDQTSLFFSAETLSFATDKLTITPVDTSPYLEAEKARLAAEAVQRANQARIARSRPSSVANSTVRTLVSGSVTQKQGYNACSCVSFVQSYYPGIRTTNGYAITFPINSNTPVVGGVVITRESSWGSRITGHVAIITAIEGEFLVLKEANYSRCRVTSGRRLRIDSSLIKGYYY